MVDADHVRTASGIDTAAVIQSHAFGRIGADQIDGCGQGHDLLGGQLKDRGQQAGGHVVGGQGPQCPSLATSRAEAFPEWDPPRTTLGAPIMTSIPFSEAQQAASVVVGNSLMEMPLLKASSTCSTSVSSWLAMGRWR